MRALLTLFCLIFVNAIAEAPSTLQDIVREARQYEADGQDALALETYFRGLAINPDIIDAQFGKDIGTWKPEHRLAPDEDIEGKIVLIDYRKGHGDTIQFARFLTPFIEKYRPAKVLFIPQKALVALFRQSQHMLGDCIEVIDPTLNLRKLAYDKHTHLLSLPYLVDAKANNLPHKDSYLTTQTTLFDTSYGKIGIIWQGDPSHIHDKDRSTTLKAFSALKDIPGLRFYSIQAGFGSEQLTDPNNGWGGNIVDLGQHCHSFADTASFMKAMDIIITIDSAGAHLATALGKSTYILLPAHPDLRWVGKSQNSFWSNNATLVRQSTPGDWTELFEHLKTLLMDHVMFTGIVKGTFPISKVNALPGLTRFSVKLTPELTQNLVTGASVSVDGVCLTVTDIHDQEVSFDVIAETLSKTTLSDIKEGKLVNIERSLRFGDEVGGHLLSGHVFGTGTIQSIDKTQNNHVVTVRCDAAWMPYIFPKGYIALDGASLTVVDTFPEGLFTVHLIPETLRLTTFGHKAAGDRINIEIDSQIQAIVDTVQRLQNKECCAK
ncbi:MAG: riboflavin synthase subunit alpha [Chlamydiales bacterium]|nr:riboflavin synthase subunit alpha [Chlamydiales bacterium]